ncbi:exodeoxyribonuclease VII large subunit, partial [Ameyamaea chiangmaiensis]
LLGLLRVQRARLDVLAGRLEAMSPLGVLERGYVLVRDADGRPVTRAEGARPGAQVTLTFRDGERAARIERPRTGAQGTLDI